MKLFIRLQAPRVPLFRHQSARRRSAGAASVLILCLLTPALCFAAGDADTVLVLPGRAEQLELGGYLQVRYQEGGTFGSFSVRRARLQLEGRIQSELRFELDVDLSDLGLSDTAQSARALKDVILEARPHPKFRIRAEQFKKAFLLEEETSSRSLPVIERGLLSDHLRKLGYAGRDVGAEARYTMKKSKWRAQMSLSLMNGEGANQGRISDGMSDLVLNLVLNRKGIGSLIGAIQWKSRPDVPRIDEKKAVAAMLGLAVEWHSLSFEGEWLTWAVDPRLSVSEFDDRGHGLRGMALLSSPRRFLGLHKMEIGLRAEYLEPNESRARGRGDGLARWTGTMTFYLHKNSRIRIGPQIDWVQDPAYDTTTSWMAEWQLSY
ncbi:MAG: OprO/OprP family phosphate-selective porin [Candidatus Eisenbacteria bacterium]|nr:OprO/OprP family phosphate-selective porin [Candidatus Eisenbacteria bacterium]